MSEPFLAEIKIMSFNFPPKGWALCNGQFLPINQNQALFALLGTNFGGNGQTTFALPDLRGRVPVHIGLDVSLGQRAGEEEHAVTLNELPTHTHVLQATANDATAVVPGSNLLARTTAANRYRDEVASAVALHPASVSSVGGSEPHDNMQPYLVLNFCIALEGIFPSRT